MLASSRFGALRLKSVVAQRRVFVGSRRQFRLERKFVNSFRDRNPKFGFNGLGELVYYRTYARMKDNGHKETWYETVERVVNGVFSMKERWFKTNGLDSDEAHLKVSIC